MGLIGTSGNRIGALELPAHRTTPDSWELQLFSERVQFEAVTRGEIACIRVPIPGGFTIYNAPAALSAGLVPGLPLKEMALAFP